jgi:sigma-B regulation protein RsbU (phosphoserine phosphatase)
VIANETSTLIEMPENVFWEQYVHFPGAVGNLLQVLVGRMHYNNEEIIRTAEQRIEFEHMQKEMENAGKIQLGILPIDPLFPNHPQVDVYAAMDPATEVGGDFYDAFALDEDHIYVAIGDVSGKGMAAALFMMQCVSLLRMSMFNEMRVDLVIPEINNVLTESIDGQLFLTLFAAVINVRTGEMEYMNGGHNPPFIMRAGSDFEMLPMPKGTLMGIMPDTHYEVARITLAPGDVLVIYTDGVTEAESTDGGFYEEAPAMAVLCQHKDADMRTLLTKLKDDVDRFSKGHKQSDDITILALRYLGDQ